jgi:NAD(P)-dependent dehydrogenase (short-subunit alcohol dehydrogenase family)
VIGDAVVVTGASTGIGEACALYLDKLGYHVFAGVRRDEDGERLSSAASDRLKPIKLDVTDHEQIEAAAETVAKDADGMLAGLVNNAGVVVAGPLEFIPIDDIRRQFDVNVIGQVAMIQALLPHLRSGRGRIVNIGSVSGKLSGPFAGPYSASKFALEALTDSLRMELKPWGIHVSIVEPGNIATPIWQKGIAEGKDRRGELPPEAEALYGDEMEMMLRYAEVMDSRGIPPDRVAKAVAHALGSSRPKTRYLVGNDAILQAAVAKVLPDKPRDWVVKQGMRAFRPS